MNLSKGDWQRPETLTNKYPVNRRTGTCARAALAGTSRILVALLGTCVAIAADPQATQTPQQVTPPIDSMFSQPFIDIDEWRNDPVRHRYVHGGFKGTDTLFSIYFPPKEQYQGRFFQPVAAVSGNENAAQQQAAQVNPLITNENSTIGFAIASGGYLVESNLGAKDMYSNGGLSMYRASAAVAQHSRVLAAEMYGPHRPYGYTYGGSGGGYKTIAAAENTTGVWDGFVPYVIGSPVSIPNVFTVQAHAVRVLKDKWRDVVDAVDPGGSGDMYATLNQEERDALLEVTRMGFPPRVWFYYDRLGYGPLSVLIDQVVARDRSYFEDFWTVPGYLGANPPESLTKARIQHKTTITKIIMSDEARKLGLTIPMAANGTNVIPAAFKLADMPKGDLKGATLIIQSGGAKDAVLSISSVKGDLVSIGVGGGAFRAVNKIKTSDEVQLDNSVYLAAQTYHRHQVPGPEYTVWDQFRGPDGKPLYPQRSRPRGDSGGGQSGKFQGKMIVVETLVDEYAYPWQADWYRTQVKNVLGDRLDDNFRLWHIDNAMHTTPVPGSDRTRIVPYTNALQQALRDVAAWAEKGIVPPATTEYKVLDGQVIIPPTAAQRKGIQPVVTLTANGGSRAEVKVGEPVNFSGVIEVPPGTGKVVEAHWDFEGKGDYPVTSEIKPTDRAPRTIVTTTYTFSKPGTYFPVLRAASQRTPDETPYARVLNLARVRVVVK